MSHSAGLNMRGIGTRWRFMTKSTKGIIMDGGMTWRGVGPIHKPGTKYDYSGRGVTVAEHILELETGQSFSKWAKSNVLKSLRITQSTFAKASPKMTNLAQGCSKGPCLYKVKATRVKGAGGLLGTAGDYAPMVSAPVNAGRIGRQKVLPKSVIDEVITAACHRNRSGKSCTNDSTCLDETYYRGKCRRLLGESGGSNGLKDGMGVELSGPFLDDGYHR